MQDRTTESLEKNCRKNKFFPVFQVGFNFSFIHSESFFDFIIAYFHLLRQQKTTTEINISAVVKNNNWFRLVASGVYC